MTSTYKVYIPNLNDLLSENYQTYIDSEKLNTYMIPEVNKTTKNVRRDTLIDLLFNDHYAYDDYSIYFKRVNASYFEKNIRDRLLGTNKLIICYVPATAIEIDSYFDSTEDHSVEMYELFGLNDSDKYIIGNLNYLKRSGELLDENLFEMYLFGELGNLSKLVYVNILFLLGNLTYIELLHGISVESLNSIELLYMEQLFIKSYSFLIGNDYLLGNTIINGKIKSINVIPDEDMMNNREVIIYDNIIDNKISVKYKDSVLRRNMDYELVNVDGCFKVVFTNDDIVLDENEFIRLRYYFHQDLPEYTELDLKQKNTGFFINE